MLQLAVVQAALLAVVQLALVVAYGGGSACAAAQ
jgi:hypothetical protein